MITKYAIASTVILPLMIASCGGKVEPSSENAPGNGGTGGNSNAGAGGSYAGAGGSHAGAGGSYAGAGGSHAGAGGSYAGAGGTLPEAGPDVTPPEAGPDVTPDAVFPCPGDGTCSGHGTCDTSVATCKCHKGFAGVTCAACSDGYTGYPDCHVPLPCPADCSGFGTCDDTTGTCSCDATHAGPACDSCATGYVGYPACAPAKPCPNDCSGHGTCDGLTGVCACDPAYKGDACSACVKSHWLNQAFTVDVHEPVNLALGDIDGDGLLDLAVSNWSQPTVTTFRGLGTGDFGSKSVLQASGYPSELRLVDLDFDGALDLVVIADGNADGVGKLGVYRNSGAGSFGPAQFIEMQQDFTSIDTGDVNHDGKPDIVVVDFFAKFVRPLHGDGTGGFQAASPHPVGTNPFSVAVGDLDGDGWDDIVVPSEGRVGVLFNKPGGTAPLTTFPSSEWPHSVRISDLTGDGQPDILTTFMSGRISYLRNTGGGTFADAGVFEAGAAGALGASTGDLDGNGLADVVVPGFWQAGTTVMLNTGNGLLPHQLLGAGGEPHDSAVADVNRDGRLDVLVCNSNVNEVVVYLNECIP